MIQNIDFLPECYRQRRQRRQETVWRRCVLGVFLSVIVAGALEQRHARGKLEVRRNQMQQQAQRMVAGLADPAELRRQIEQLDAQANLVTMFRVRVPMTRVLSTVTAALPRYVTLTEFKTAYDKLDLPTAKSPQRDFRRGAPQPAEEKFPALADFEQLTTRDQETALFVSLRGLAPDDIAISNFLGALEVSGMFDDVKLLFTDRSVYRDIPLRSFAVRLRVRKPRAAAVEPATTAPAPNHGPVALRP